MSLKPQPKTFYLIDISSLFFRSYYAISLNLKNDKGSPTNALYGVLKMLQQLGQSKSPDYWLACFDAKEPSFRKSLYPEYKANRSEMPEDLEAQAPNLKKMMDKFLIPYWEQPGYEADDLIASLTALGKKQNWTVYIVSGDKDFAQLVSEGVCLYDTMKDVVYDSKGVEAKWGVRPSQMRDYLSLTGDSSDNIPGVRGIGPKGAVQLLKAYNSLDGVYSNIDKIKGALREKLAKDKEMAFLSRELVALKTDVAWDKDLSLAKYQAVSGFSKKDRQSLREFLEELNFKSFIKKFFPEPVERGKSTEDLFAHSKAPSTGQISFRLSSKQISLTAQSAEEFKSALPPYAGVWMGLFRDQFYLAYGKKMVLISERDLKDWAGFLDYKWARYLGHDLKRLWKKLEVKNPVPEWDSMIAGHLLDSKPSPSFRKLCEIYLSVSEEEELNAEQTALYAQELKQRLFNCLQQEELSALFQDIELPLTAVLYDMERRGALIDERELERQSAGLAQDIQNLEFQIHKLAGEEFNLSSPKQLAVVLFEKLKLPRGRKTKTGYSTDSYELMKIKNLHPILPLLLEHRELFKLKSAYTDSLISLRDKRTGRVYTEFKQTGTSTGRLASANPNLQNIPIQGERGQLIRKAFIAGPGQKLISADYSQIELRILAHITEDPNLLRAFEQNLDIHAITASELFSVPAKEVSSELRRRGKAVNFGIAYGQGAYGLSEALSIPRSEAKEIIDNYFKKFKKIKEYIEAVKEDLPKRNYVKTLYGRKRFFNPEDLKHPRWRAGAERAAINAPLQGTASDLVKKAMIALNESLPIPLLSQVHDELLFECPVESVERESGEILSIMEKDDLLKAPLKVNLAVGKNWLTAHS